MITSSCKLMICWCQKINQVLQVEVNKSSVGFGYNVLKFHVITICNGRTDWSPIRSVTIRVINKIGRPHSWGSPIYYLFNHKNDYQLHVIIILTKFVICKALFLKSKHKKFQDFFARSEKKLLKCAHDSAHCPVTHM